MDLSKEAREARARYQREYYARNPDKIRAINARWRARNPDKIREYRRRYWERVAQRTTVTEDGESDMGVTDENNDL